MRKVKQSAVVSRIPFCSLHLLLVVAGRSANRSSPNRGRHRRTVGIQPKQVNISTLWTQVSGRGAFALRDTRMEAHRDILLSRPFLIFLLSLLTPLSALFTASAGRFTTCIWNFMVRHALTDVFNSAGFGYRPSVLGDPSPSPPAYWFNDGKPASRSSRVQGYSEITVGSMGVSNTLPTFITTF